MENLELNNKYQIVETLNKSESQAVFLATEKDDELATKHIINEIVDGDIIFALKDSFSPEKISKLQNFVETFYIDSKLYIVFKLCRGNLLENYLSSNDLRMLDKLGIVENLLNTSAKMQELNPLILYTLLDPSNISIVGRKGIGFNNILLFDKNNLSPTTSECIQRIGTIIKCVFINTVNIDDTNLRDDTPPAISNIIEKCENTDYDNIYKIYDDFKSTLIYTTLMGVDSLDAKLRSTKKKINKKYFVMPRVRTFSAILLAFFLAYFTWNSLNKAPKAPVSSVITTQSQNVNEKPEAMFCESLSKIYEGDEVTFINQSKDPDLTDTVKTSSWTLQKDGITILKDTKDSLVYKFDSQGLYTLSLIVADASGNHSNPYIKEFFVYKKDEMPQDIGKTNSTNDRK